MKEREPRHPLKIAAALLRGEIEDPDDLSPEERKALYESKDPRVRNMFAEWARRHVQSVLDLEAAELKKYGME